MPETMYNVKETGKWLRSPHLKGVNKSIDLCNFNMLYNVNVTLNYAKIAERLFHSWKLIQDIFKNNLQQFIVCSNHF